MADGTLVCGTKVITDLEKDLRQQVHDLLFKYSFLKNMVSADAILNNFMYVVLWVMFIGLSAPESLEALRL